MTSLTTFCRQVRARTEEHREAIHLLHGRRLLSQVVAVLRQELDSMVRVIFLISIADKLYRHQLIDASVNGEKWTVKGKKACITDGRTGSNATRLDTIRLQVRLRVYPSLELGADPGLAVFRAENEVVVQARVGVGHRRLSLQASLRDARNNAGSSKPGVETPGYQQATATRSSRNAALRAGRARRGSPEPAALGTRLLNPPLRPTAGFPSLGTL
jgi:hypothetical protein